MIGQLISHYRIVGKIGEGGMGVVYRAIDTRLDRPVALKMLAPEALGSPDRKRRFIQEARTVSALNHPNIVTIYDIGNAAIDGEGRTFDFIAMEFIEGKTLYELIGGKGLRLQEALKYGIQITDALAAAHAAGIVHRDLKPPNIMVTGPGKRPGLVKVLDFGVAKLLEPEERLPETDPNAPTESVLVTPVRTSEGTFIGTVAYMSPEQAEGMRVDARSDIFSFGSLFYEMLTGRQAFQGGSRLSVLTAILRDEPSPAHQVTGEIPAELDAVVERCLRKDPDRRFQSAADVRAVLQDIEDRWRLGKTHLTTTVTERLAAPVLLTRKSRKKLWLALAALVVAVGAMGLAPPMRERLSSWLSLSAHGVPAQKRIVVLPFANIGGDPANQAFCDGLAETLTGALTQLEQFQGSLWVVPASEVRREAVSSPRTAQRAFGANLAITGAVQRAGDQVRLTANLVDAATLQQLESRSIDAQLDKLTTLQDGVVRRVVEMLNLQLAPKAEQVLAAGGTARSGAYDLYLRGRGTLQRFDRPGNVQEAIRLFEQALEQDSGYALAYAGLGDAYLRQYGLTKERKWLEEAQSAARRALQLNDSLAAAHVNLGMVEANTGQSEAAIAEFQRALELDPVAADAYRELANVYEAAGRVSEAEATYLKAIQLRPSDWLGSTLLAVFYTRHGRYAEAEPFFRRVIELSPDNTSAYRNLGGLYYLMGRYDQAIQMNQKSLAIGPTAAAYSNLGTIYFFQGRYREAVSVNEKAVQLAPENDRNDFVLWGNLGDSYRWTPELADKAPAAYRRAIEAARRKLELNPNDARVLSFVAVYWAKLADNQSALGAIAKARQLGPSDLSIGFKSVLVYELTHQRPRALAALEAVLKGGYSIEEVRREPELDQLRRDPACQRLLAQYEGKLAAEKH